ncbi:MAG: hypothetical protein RR595_04695 [Lysinibacillus sp.]
MKIAAITAIVSALFMGFALKGLNFFHLIKWNPVGFYKKTVLFNESSGLFKWFFLIIILFCIAMIMYLVMQYAYFVPAAVTSFLIGFVLTITLEWYVLDLPLQVSSFKKLSIPFMVTVICLLRFIIQTAVYHKQEQLAHREIVDV